jgi:hypothetical protein
MPDNPDLYGPPTPDQIALINRAAAFLGQRGGNDATPSGIGAQPPPSPTDLYAPPTPGGQAPLPQQAPPPVPGGENKTLYTPTGEAVRSNPVSKTPAMDMYLREAQAAANPPPSSFGTKLLHTIEDLLALQTHQFKGPEGRAAEMAQANQARLEPLRQAALEEEMSPYRQAQAEQASAVAGAIRRTGAPGRAGVIPVASYDRETGAPVWVYPSGLTEPRIEGLSRSGSTPRQAAPPMPFRQGANGQVINMQTGEVVHGPTFRPTVGRNLPASKVDPNTGLTQQQAKAYADAQRNIASLQTERGQETDPQKIGIIDNKILKIKNDLQNVFHVGGGLSPANARQFAQGNATPAPAQETAPKPQSTGGSKIIYDPQGKPYHVVNGQWVPLK